jgi:Zn-finger nucleic acid-binding protein
MHRVNFARCSGVVVDVCREHGTWFDLNELQRIMQFIRSGGLDRVRERQRRELEEERRRLESARRERDDGSALPGRIGLQSSLLEAVVGSTSHLLDGWLRR